MKVCPKELSARDLSVVNVARKDTRRWECDVPRKPSQSTAGIWARNPKSLSFMARFYPSRTPLGSSFMMGCVPSFLLEEKREAMSSELSAK